MLDLKRKRHWGLQFEVIKFQYLKYNLMSHRIELKFTLIFQRLQPTFSPSNIFIKSSYHKIFRVTDGKSSTFSNFKFSRKKRLSISANRSWQASAQFPSACDPEKSQKRKNSWFTDFYRSVTHKSRIPLRTFYYFSLSAHQIRNVNFMMSCKLRIKKQPFVRSAFDKGERLWRYH